MEFRPASARFKGLSKEIHIFYWAAVTPTPCPRLGAFFCRGAGFSQRQKRCPLFVTLRRRWGSLPHRQYRLRRIASALPLAVRQWCVFYRLFTDQASTRRIYFKQPEWALIHYSLRLRLTIGIANKYPAFCIALFIQRINFKVCAIFAVYNFGKRDFFPVIYSCLKLPIIHFIHLIIVIAMTQWVAEPAQYNWEKTANQWWKESFNRIRRIDHSILLI